ncbi:MAG: transporter substrate-binding domain-containing protein [Devosia sp.]|nr:transporter substrate-binding domain-containing protein [Devosia sp.]
MLKSLLLAMVASVALMGAARAGTVDEIKARGSLIVGVEAKNPPGVYRDGNDIVGYDVDIAKYVADKLGVKLQLVDTDWDGILPALNAGKFDAIFSSMSITKDRLSKVNFSNPYNSGSMSFLVYADSDIKTAHDMAGKKLGVAIGSFYVKPIDAYSQKLQAQSLQPIETDTYNSLPDVLTDLMNKRIDAAIERPVTFRLWEKQTGQDPSKFRIIPDLTDIIATANVHGAAVPKTNDSLLALINTTLDEMRSNGKLQELQAKWLGGPVDVPATIPDNIP